ncbi:MAG: DNA repair protein RecN [Actinobacteria bacterium]|nr:DNA repair protein RecN [Actinomycetota bacterium]
MLKELQVKNFAIIDDISVKFGTGLNILTGETGAGKTLIIEAINMLSGERADSSLIRDGEEKLTVQGYFDLSQSPKSIDFLKSENLAESDDDFTEIVITREISRQGKNRAFINGIFTQAGTLKLLSSCFLDMHGQHDHQYLLDASTHIEIIDSFKKNEIGQVKQGYISAYLNFIDAARGLVELKKIKLQKEASLQQMHAILDEIEGLNLAHNEEDDLENEKNILKNHEKIFRICSALLNSLNGQERASPGLVEEFAVFIKNLSELSGIDKKFERFSLEMANAHPSLAELAVFLKDYTDNFDFSAERLDSIQERLYKIAEIKRKYSMDIAGINEYGAAIKKEIMEFEGIDEEIEAKQKEYRFKRDILAEYAIKLSSQRKAAIVLLEDEVKSQLKDLNFKSPQFEVSHWYNEAGAAGAHIEIEGQKVKPAANGIDFVEFLVSLNAGESVKPLKKIASGGEISRIMLALKSIISGTDNIVTMIFDEIDTGIGGVAGIITGKKLHDISGKCQVLCITHLPQISAFAEHHYFIEKITDGGRTKIRILKIEGKDRIKEISRMLSGMAESEISIKHATELINETGALKNSSLADFKNNNNLEVRIN